MYPWPIVPSSCGIVESFKTHTHTHILCVCVFFGGGGAVEEGMLMLGVFKPLMS